MLRAPHQLRKKLGQCGVEGESSKALRGMGYRLCVPRVVVRARGRFLGDMVD